MVNFLAILLVTSADVVGVVAGLMFIGSAWAHLTGFCGAPPAPWHFVTLEVLIGLVFALPNALVRLICRRLSSRGQLIVAVSRAVLSSALALFGVFDIAFDGGPLLLYPLIVARPFAAFALALEIDRRHKARNSEQLRQTDSSSRADTGIGTVQE